MKLLDYIPDSISALVYKLKSRKYIWILSIWAMAFSGFYFMIEHNEQLSALAFLACSSLAFVGAMPLVKNQKNTLHNILGTVAAILSQLWVFLDQYPDYKWLLIVWIIYAILLLILKNKWCFVAELICIGTVVKSIIPGI